MLGRKVMFVRCINCSYNNVAKGILLRQKLISILIRIWLEIISLKSDRLELGFSLSDCGIPCG